MRIHAAFAAVAAFLAAGAAHAHPQFHAFVDQTSGRKVNCALCHAHPDGPEGLKPGQIGSLSSQQMDALNRARAAFEPGQDVNSPVLNAFGNEMVRQLGKTRILGLLQDPGALATALDPAGDIDGDGVPDAEEYLAGTLPTDPYHGPPWRLSWARLQSNWIHVVMMLLATAAGLYGLRHLLHGLDASLPQGNRGGGGART
jgi:hypothetical protein